MTRSLAIRYLSLAHRLPRHLGSALLLAGLMTALISGCGAAPEPPEVVGSVSQPLAIIVDIPECVVPGDSWVDSTLTVNPSDRVSFRCWGDVWTGLLFAGPVGPDGWGDAKDRKFPVTVAEDPEANEFGVVGSFGPGSRFQVGRVTTKVAPPPFSTGVWLKMNDDTPCNGSGAFHCEVTVEAATDCRSNSDCREGSYCVHKTMCGGPGICTPKGVGSCPMTPDPVCGCNGRSYSTPCAAHREGVAVNHKGLCP